MGIEFNSLSKTYNLTGLRISFALGNADVIKHFKTIRSQFDYGTSYIVQKAAVAALNGPQDGVVKQQAQYQSRRDALCDGLNAIGWKVPYSEGTMFVWAPVPKQFKNSDEFCIQMLENTGVVCTPGSAFGSLGENHVRFALVLNENLIKEAKKEFGRVDILVNNAGITKDNLIIRMKEEDFDSVIKTNLKGAFNCLKAVTPIMLKQKYGKIVNMASVVGVVGNPGQVNYCASKAGLIGMTKSHAKEIGSRNITVNAIAPGFIDTDMTKILSDDQKKKILSQIPLNKFGNVEDIANVALFLGSENSNYITGQVIHVDGGMAM